MAVNLKIQAEVVDISTDSPTASDIYLVDSNVWYWTAYSRASVSTYYRGEYDSYLKKALAADSRLYASGLSQSELIHLVEKAEYDFFSRTQSVSVTAKEFRHNFSAQRAAVIQEVALAWGVVDNIAQIVDIRVDKPMTARVIARFRSCALDGYDLIAAEAMVEHGIPQVLTDDGDFATIPGITLFTANRNVIRAATAQGKVVVR